jgi:hypothetical protein
MTRSYEYERAQAAPFVGATGGLETFGGRIVTADGRIVGPDGTLYATGSTSCLVLKVG